jgi:D-glucosaminate-6-phosphate ammonia-lyase
VGVYDELGLRTVINASGTLTRLGGSRMAPEVLAAMAEAAASFVPIDALQARAGEIIAEVTGAEAGYVVSGAAAGLSLGVAACVAGMDVAAMDRLPDTAGLKDEVVVQRGHRNAYDHAIRAVGVRMVEVGYLGYRGRLSRLSRGRRHSAVADRRRDRRADGGGRLPDSRYPRHGAIA